MIEMVINLGDDDFSPLLQTVNNIVKIHCLKSFVCILRMKNPNVPVKRREINNEFRCEKSGKSYFRNAYVMICV